MIGFVDAVKMFFKGYVDFSGRASRAEYWWATLFVILTIIVLSIPAFGLLAVFSNDSGEPSPFAALGIIPVVIFGLAVIIPSISLMIRRLHDINQTGWIYLGLIVLGLIPIVSVLSSVGTIIVGCMPGTVGPNKYGADPYGSTTDVFN